MGTGGRGLGGPDANPTGFAPAAAANRGPNPNHEFRGTSD